MTYDLGVIKRQRYVSPPYLGLGGTTSNHTVGGINYTVHTFTASGTFYVLAPGTIEYLVVAGGASGTSSGNGGSPGGGAGGLIYRPTRIVEKNTLYVITIGAGGAGGPQVTSNPGTNTTVVGGDMSLTAIYGGGVTKGGTFVTDGLPGGSGGGASKDGSAGGAGIQPIQPGESGLYGFGNAGARLGSDTGGGGGGAGGAASGSNGGIGKSYSISGSSQFYAGGGGGNNYSGGVDGTGGSGVGGTAPGGNAVVNTGSGGAGRYGQGGAVSGSGSSGIVIIRYPTPVNSQLFNDPYFNSTSLLLTGRTEAYPSVVDYIVVAGGGAGGENVGGGGGAGGLIQVLSFAAPWQTKTYYTVTIGAGGVGTMGANTGGAGGNSSFSTTAVSGGGGGGSEARNGASGGSGGGGGWFGGNTGGAGIAGQGNDGTTATGTFYAGGGGGKGAASTSAEGGVGLEWPTGSGIFYATGGGGGYSSTVGQSAAANTGNGGSGAGFRTYTPGGNGGSGVVIIRHDAKSAPAITIGNPTIEVSNGYRYYTFKTSGSIQWGSDNTFRDSSYNALTVTPAGTPTQGSFSPFSQNWSTYFNGSSYLSIPNNAAFNFSTGDFTIEMWINPSSVGSWWLLGKGDGATVAGSAFSFYHGATWDIYYGSSTLSITKPSLDVGVWQHIAVVRSTTTITIYKNGVSVSTGTIGANAINTGGANPLNIGQYSAAGLPGYISNLRIVKGTAVYTANFTPPTSPLTVISNTVLLTCASNRFLDKSGTTSTITAVGSPSVKPLAPFRGNDYNALVQGGSGFFSGTGDYLSLSYNSAFNLGTGSFTWEAWIYPTNISGIDGIYSTSGGSGANPKFVIHLNAGTPNIHYNNLTGGSDIYTAATSAVAVNTWTHLAFVRNSSTWTWYINGVVAGTGSNSTNITFTTQSTYIGYGGESYFTEFNGYISNLRMIKGTAVYTANFTPPAAPVTALNTSSSTSLLLNFTNAGIIDYTAQNDLISINTATLSTSIIKYNTRSVKVNGIADYLTLPATSDAFVFRTGDFTVEYWVYYNALPASVTVICGNATGAAGLAFGASSTAKLHMFSNTTAYTSTGATLVTGQWYHVAFVRQSGSVKYYLNGALDYTVAVATDITELTGSVGAKTGGTLYSNCYIDDLRVTKGVARYTAAFSAPLKTLQLK